MSDQTSVGLHILDNPVWHSLSTRQAKFAEGDDHGWVVSAYDFLFDLGIIYVAALITDALVGKWGRTNRESKRLVSRLFQFVKRAMSHPVGSIEASLQQVRRWIPPISMTPKTKRILWSLSDTGLFIVAVFFTKYFESGQNFFADQLIVGIMLVAIFALVSVGGSRRYRGSGNQWLKYAVRSVGCIFGVLAGAFSDGIRDLFGLVPSLPGQVAAFVVIIAAYVGMSVYLLKVAEDSVASGLRARTWAPCLLNSVQLPFGIPPTPRFSHYSSPSLLGISSYNPPPLFSKYLRKTFLD